MVVTPEEAMRLRTQFAANEIGIFFIDRELARGCDPKFKKDSHVIIFETSEEFQHVNDKFFEGLSIVDQKHVAR